MRRRSSGGDAEPPPPRLRTELRSRRSKVGEFSTSQSIVGTPEKDVTHSRSMRSSATSGSHRRMKINVPPKKAWPTSIEWLPVAWKSGTDSSSTGGSPGAGAEPSRSALLAALNIMLTRFVQMFRWVPSTPFGRALVPEV